MKGQYAAAGIVDAGIGCAGRTSASTDTRRPATRAARRSRHVILAGNIAAKALAPANS